MLINRNKLIHCFFVFIFASIFLFLAKNNALAYSSSAKGYASLTSQVQGKSIDFNISSYSSEITIFIYEMGKERLAQTLHVTGLTYLPCPYSEMGCNWPVKSSVTLNASQYPSGLYYAFLVDGNLASPPAGIVSDDSLNKIPFIVKSNEPGSKSKILLQFPTNTWQAYNPTTRTTTNTDVSTGACFYPFPQCRQQVSTISFNRPYKPDLSLFISARKFTKWIADNGYTFDYAANEDLENSTFINNYRLIISFGHDEYWSSSMKKNAEAFRNAGGNLIFFSSNTSYWQVRFNPANRAMTSYKKNFTEDPQYGFNNNLVTTYFSAYSGNTSDPTKNIPGRDFNHDGQLLGNHSGQFAGAGGYNVYNTKDPKVAWIFANTGLSDGASIGVNTQAAAASEVDFVPTTWTGGMPVPAAGADYTPLKNLEILGQSPVTGGATLVMYSSAADAVWGTKSTVLSSGSWNWVDTGLVMNDPTIVNITKNAIARMSSLPGGVNTQVPQEPNRFDTQTGIEDTFISAWSPTTNYVTSPTLSIRPADVMSSLFRINTSSIPANAEILGASLDLTYLGNASNVFSVYVRKVKKPVVLSQTNWNLFMNGGGWDTLGAQGNGDTDLTSAPSDKLWWYMNNPNGKTYSFTITDLVKDAVKNGNTVSFALTGDGPNQDHPFAAAEFSIADKRPRLRITYRGASPITPPTATPTVVTTGTPTPTPTLTITPKVTPSTSPTMTCTPTPSISPKVTPSVSTTKTPTPTPTPIVLSPTPTPAGCKTETITKNITSVIDTYVDQWNPTTNYATSTLGYLRQDVQKPLFYFNLADVPKTATLSSGLFNFQVAYDRDVPSTYSFYAVKKDWFTRPTETNWTKAYGNLNWDQAGILASSDRSQTAAAVLTNVSDGVQSVDLKKQIQNWVSGKEVNDGFVIEIVSSASISHVLITSENGDYANTQIGWKPVIKPNVELKYTVTTCSN